MKLTPVRCPNCGAQVEVDETARFAWCSHCGCQMVVEDEISRFRQERLENEYKLAKAAFAAGNFVEAYQYYARCLAYDADLADALFHKGLCALYLSPPGQVRTAELLAGLSQAVSLRLRQGDIRAALNDVAESFHFARWFYQADWGRHDLDPFYNWPQLANYLNRTIALADLMGGLLTFLPYEWLRRFPDAARLKQDMAAFGIELYRRTGLEYVYGNPPPIQMKYRLPGFGQYRDRAAQLELEGLNAPQVNDALYQLDEQIRASEAQIHDFESQYQRFWQENPLLYQAYCDIPLIGREEKQTQFIRAYFPAKLQRAWENAVQQQSKLRTLRAQRRRYLDGCRQALFGRRYG